MCWHQLLPLTIELTFDQHLLIEASSEDSASFYLNEFSYIYFAPFKKHTFMIKMSHFQIKLVKHICD